MKQILILGLILSLFSCNKKTINLPEIKTSKIHEINDVSAAYLFYNEQEEDSVELNRKNLISTTNWLVNIDKRLTLKQVIPHIKTLQDKKNNSGHTNENARNYFTCNDTSTKNLGFIDFTGVVYHDESIGSFFAKIPNVNYYNQVILYCYSLEDIKIMTRSSFNPKSVRATDQLIDELKGFKENTYIVMSFKDDLSFQDYISLMSIVGNSGLKHYKILNHEFIFN